MIVPMKKVSLILLNRDKKDAMKVLRKAGVMHVETLQGKGADFTAKKAAFAKVESAVSVLSTLKPDKAAKKNPVDLSYDDAVKKAEEINSYFSMRKESEELIAKNERELERFEKWGNIDPADIVYLKEKGVPLSLYEISSQGYYKISDEVKTILVNKDKNSCRFLLINENEDAAKNLPEEALPVSLPEASTVSLRACNEEERKKNESYGEKIQESLLYLDSLKKAAQKLEKEVEFETVCSGMETDGEETTSSLAWLRGFVPEPEIAGLKNTAAENNWGLLIEDPTEEDPVPTKLKNSKAVQILYPVLDFLGTVPGYYEFDISAWFLMFLTIFFAMIFGDAGYGMLMLVIGGALAFKSKFVDKEKNIPPVITLLLLWAGATAVWGILNCSWFGIEYAKLPVFLQKLALPAFSPENPEKNMNLQIFCFILALIQMSIGHVLAFMRNLKQKSLKLLADIGALGMLWGMFFVVLCLIVSSERFPVKPVVIIMIAVGFVLNFCFSNYEGSVGKSILESLKNIISVLLGVINYFSDIVSYIRLWAVALAGGAIAETVNTMAGPMLGNFLIFLGIILLVFGHGLNMVLNVLSVIVHGVRLNTLEFTSHVGMSWAGCKYEPFKE